MDPPGYASRETVRCYEAVVQGVKQESFSKTEFGTKCLGNKKYLGRIEVGGCDKALNTGGRAAGRQGR